MVFLKNALMCIYIKSELINHDCLPILMLLYIMLAYLMLFVCIMLPFFLPFISANAFFFMLCLGLLTHSLFISCVNLHHAQCC